MGIKLKMNVPRCDYFKKMEGTKIGRFSNTNCVQKTYKMKYKPFMLKQVPL